MALNGVGLANWELLTASGLIPSLASFQACLGQKNRRAFSSA
jgi:hypothetical protein